MLFPFLFTKLVPVNRGLILMKIMVVDDNKDMRKMIADLIHAGSNEIYELEDGDEAVAMFGKIRPDWVLMDIKMKRMNGLEAAKRIKERYHDARIVIVSKYDDKFFRIFAAKVGAEKFVSKQNLLELRSILN